jgi:hypothetical protein
MSRIPHSRLDDSQAEGLASPIAPGCAARSLEADRESPAARSGRGVRELLAALREERSSRALFAALATGD